MFFIVEIAIKPYEVSYLKRFRGKC